MSNSPVIEILFWYLESSKTAQEQMPEPACSVQQQSQELETDNCHNWWADQQAQLETLSAAAMSEIV